MYLDAGNTSSYSGTGSTWFDLSGQSNNATLNSSPTWSSSDGGRFSFNGTTQYASGSINMGNVNQFTIMFTLQNTTRAGDGQFFTLGNDTSSGGENILVYTGSSLDYAVSCYSPTIYSIQPRYSPHTLELNKWYNIAITYNENNSNMYINGRYAYSMSSNITNTTMGTQQWNLARRLSSAVSNAAGLYSNVLVYNRELTPSEIEKNFNTFRGRYGI
jgi:hypothetical protein